MAGIQPLLSEDRVKSTSREGQYLDETRYLHLEAYCKKRPREVKVLVGTLVRAVNTAPGFLARPSFSN